jgi:hypothetical protein
VAEPEFGIEVECLVLYYMAVLELSDIDEVGLDGSVMLVLHLEYLHCKHLPVLLVNTPLHYSVCALTQLLLHFKVLLKGILRVVVLKPFCPGSFEILRVSRLKDGVYSERLIDMEGEGGVSGILRKIFGRLAFPD